VNYPQSMLLHVVFNTLFSSRPWYDIDNISLCDAS